MPIDKRCKYYNEGTKENFVAYPRAYGARCEYHDEFFHTPFEGQTGDIQPNCRECERNLGKKGKVQ